MSAQAYAGFVSNTAGVPSWTLIADPDYSVRALNCLDSFLIKLGYDPETMTWRREPKAGTYQDNDYGKPVPIWITVYYRLTK